MAAQKPALVWHAFHLPKEGNTEKEYEDAFAGDPAAGRFAIADGATESAFAGPWAAQLAQGYVNQVGPWATWMPAAREQWRADHANPESPWYAEAKLEEGAYATLLGVRFTARDHKGRCGWTARAVGDSCLFHIRDQKVYRRFPLRRAKEFTNRPHLICSNRERGYTWREGHRRARGRWRPDDQLLLMTDALAQWFLLAYEAGHKPWKKLQRIEDAADFAAFIARLRGKRKIRNDDVTLLRIANDCVRS